LSAYGSADMHCAANNAGQKRHRVSPSRGKFLEKLVRGRCADQPQQGGIVFDSDPYDEWMETINKLGAHSAPSKLVCCGSAPLY
jgi:hypothetical protein